MSDVWRLPPGADAKSLPKQRRFRLKPLIALVVISSLVVGGANLYVSLHKSTAVSTKDALAEFRAESAQQPHHARGPHRSARNGEARSSHSDGSEQGSSGATNGSSNTTSTNASGPTGSTVAGGATSAGNGNSGGTSKRTTESRAPTRPEEGVYTWSIDGYEDLPGVHRDLPKESHRIITYEGSGWVEHHIYSEQKEQWFHLAPSDEGVEILDVRNRVESGPVTVDKTVVYNPPAFASIWPFKLGQTWQGSWKGKTSGTYDGKTIDHGNITIDGETVEVWVTEVSMEMHGDVEGTVLTRSWIAPELALVVKQYQDSNVEAGPGHYHSEWRGQVTSLHPQR